MVGKTLRHFKILEPLGAGGMGEVYRAYDTRLDRDVAIKVLPDELSADPDRLARFEREARLLAASSHPNVAAIHGLEEVDGIRLLVLELVDGRTLEQRLLEGRLAVEEALGFAGQIAAALESAHGAGVVHRDIKPANIVITDEGVAKVLDFGIAKITPLDVEATAHATRLTADGALMGTPTYMSPEQVRCEPSDQGVDIWAFGCILYEMLTGHSAFGRETLADTLAAVLEAEPRWSDLPADAPAGTERLLRRTLARDPKRRLRHMGDIRIELEELRGQRHEAVERSTRRLMMPTLIVAGVIVAATTGWIVLGSRTADDPAARTASLAEAADPDRSIAVLPFETLGREEPTVFTDGIHGDMLTRLSKVSGLQVTSRTSVMRFRDPQQPLPEIARQLGATWILVGEVQEAGGQVQVSARLLHAPSDRQVWADSYRRELTAGNLFDLQAELTETIAEQLQARLTVDEVDAVESVPTENLAAYRLYVEGRGDLEQRTETGMRRAADLFREAIEMDAEYALAWVGLADALVLLENYGYEDPGTLVPEAREAIRRALERNPDLPEAHASLGLLYQHLKDGPAAIDELTRAVELQPNFAEAHNWLSWVHLLLGNADEALDSARKAVALDPLSPEAVSNLALSELASGEPAEALREAARTGRIQPEFTTGTFYEGLAQYEMGRFADAAANLEGLSVAWAGAGPIGGLAVARIGLGDEATGRELLRQLERSGDAFNVGLVHAALGEHDAALSAFERVEDWDSWATLCIRFAFREVLTPLHADPRFAAILQAVDRSWGID